MNLKASWKRTKSFLAEARGELSAEPMPGAEGGSISEYEEFIEYNEFELAMDELEMLAVANPTTALFWIAMRSAAVEMGLEGPRDRYQRILDENEPLLEYSTNAEGRSVGFLSESVAGFPDSSRRCERCGQIRFYHDHSDAYYCAICNRWLEPRCSDPDCDDCASRAEFPLLKSAGRTIARLGDAG